MPTQPKLATDLTDTWDRLVHRAESRAKLNFQNRWVSEQLPGGAQISMRVEDDGQKVVRISRMRPVEQSAWTAEVIELRRNLGINSWKGSHYYGPDGGPIAEFTEPSRPPKRAA